jgi:L-ascorbate metabolism protein UlaG (beta-lactamase superfamily)
VIFDLLKAQGMEDIYAVLGKDIPKDRYPDSIECLRTLAHKTFTLPHGEELYTLQSTDAGVAFLLTCPEGVIYHAGDLNDWQWEGEPEESNAAMHQMYLRELKLIADRHVDVAFVPLDARQEHLCNLGLDEYLEIVKDTKTVYPMHFWDNTELIRQFVEDRPQYRGIVLNPEEL